jgi:hypothetical protein
MKTKGGTEAMDQFEQIYVKYFKTPFDTNIYLRWRKSIPSDNQALCTSIQFENYLLNCEEFRIRIATLFKGEYYSLMGESPTKEQVRDYHRTMSNDKQRLSEIGTTSIRSYIQKLPLFREKYSNIISRIYHTVHKDDIPGAMLDMYLEKFCSDTIEFDNTAYTLERLNADILKGVIPKDGTAVDHQPTNIVKTISRRWKEITNNEPADYEVSRVVDSLHNPSECMTAIIFGHNQFKNELLQVLIDTFASIFKRELFVEEFLKYYGQMNALRHQTREDLVKWLEEVHVRHTEAFDMARKLYSDYREEKLGELAHVKRYLYTMDDEAYERILVDECLATPVYGEKMRRLLENLYEQSYNEKVPDDDLEHMFREVQRERCHMKSLQLQTMVTDLKAQTDDYLKSLHDIYHRVLERDPDPLECVKYKALYRTEERDVTEIQINDDLYESLEYHDIVKGKLKAAYELKNGKPPLPSQLYACLGRWLSGGKEERRNDDFCASVV